MNKVMIDESIDFTRGTLIESSSNRTTKPPAVSGRPTEQILGRPVEATFGRAESAIMYVPRSISALSAGEERQIE